MAFHLALYKLLCTVTAFYNSLKKIFDDFEVASVISFLGNIADLHTLNSIRIPDSVEKD